VARSLLQDGVGGDLGASPRPLLACSACAGDYEDPDRTAWTPDPEDDEDELLSRQREQEGTPPAELKAVENDAGDEGPSEKNVSGDEFPAKEE
jgi:hypothetical protein